MDYGWIGAVKPRKGSSRSQTKIAKEVIGIAKELRIAKELGVETVSYTHLTLPTIA